MSHIPLEKIFIYFTNTNTYVHAVCCLVFVRLIATVGGSTVGVHTVRRLFGMVS